MTQHHIQPIDLVCVNLYPFAKTIANPKATFEEAIENIDIGGPAMIRSGAKNHRFVLVVTEPPRYEKVLGDLRKHSGSSCEEHRRKQAQRAFAHTAAYDATIADYLQPKDDELPEEMRLVLRKNKIFAMAKIRTRKRRCTPVHRTALIIQRFQPSFMARSFRTSIFWMPTPPSPR